MEDNAVFLPW